MRGLFACAFAVLLVGCSSGYKSESMGLGLKPPSGAGVSSEGRDQVEFEDGLQLVQVAWQAPSIADAPIEGLADEALAKAHLTMPGDRLSARKGDLGGVKCARYEYKSDSERGLLYVLPRADRTLVIRFVAPSSSSYGQKETQVERALGTLRFR